MAIRSIGLPPRCALAALCALGALSAGVCRGAEKAKTPATQPRPSAGVARTLANALAHKGTAKGLELTRTLAQDRGADALKALGAVLLKGDDAMRQVALDALICSGTTGGVDVLADFLTKGGWVWRLRVIAALRQWGSGAAIPAFRVAAADPEHRVRMAGRGGLDMIATRIARAKVVAERQRLAAVAALIEGKDPGSEAKLRTAMTDESPRVRAMAAVVLGRLKTTGAARILDSHPADEGTEVRAAVAWAKLRLTGGQVAEADADLALTLRKPVPNPHRAPQKLDLGTCIRLCKKAGPVPIFVHWPALEEKRITAKTPVKAFDRTSLAAALDSILRATGQLSLDWKAENGGIVISTPENLLHKRTYNLEMAMPHDDSTPLATRSSRARLAVRSPRQHFRAVPFEKCVDFIREVASVDVFVRWQGPWGIGVVRGVNCTVDATDASVADMLGMMLQSQPDWPWQRGAGYAVIDGVVVISSPQDLAKWQKSRPAGLSVFEAVLAGAIAGVGRDTYDMRQRDAVRDGPIGWLIDVDRPATTANVLRTLNAERRSVVSTCGLFWSMAAGRLKMARVFLAGGADVNTPWQYAGMRKAPALVWAKTGIYPPLHFAAWLGNAEFIGGLIAAGAKPNAVDQDIGSSLHVAVGRGHYMAVAALIVGKADVNVQWKGSSPLHHAAAAGYERIVSLLIDKGARVEAPSKDGTPLQRAQKALAQSEKDLQNTTRKQMPQAKAHIAKLQAVIKLLAPSGAP